MLTRILLLIFIAVFAAQPFALSAEAGQKAPLPPRKPAPEKKTYETLEVEKDTYKENRAPQYEQEEERQFEQEYARGEYFKVEARLYYWPTTFSANFATSSGGIKGDLVDYVNDLGLEEQGGFPAGEVTLKFLERNRLSVGLMFFDMHGEGNMPVSAKINGVDYYKGVRTETDLAIQFTTLAYERDIVRAPQGYIAIRCSVNLIEMHTSITTNVLSVVKNENIITITVPKLGAVGRVNINDFISVTGGISAIGFGANYFMDGSVYVDVNPAPNFGAFAGYRVIRLEVDVEEAEGEIQWSGLMAGVAVRF